MEANNGRRCRGKEVVLLQEQEGLLIRIGMELEFIWSHGISEKRGSHVGNACPDLF